jgi:hypothetical protein
MSFQFSSMLLHNPKQEALEAQNMHNSKDYKQILTSAQFEAERLQHLWHNH